VIDPIPVIKKQIQGSYPDNKFRFDKFDVELSLYSLTYADLDVKNQRPVGIQRSVFTNNTGVQDTQTFTVDKTTSDSFSWSLTEGVKVSTKFKVKIPFVGDSETSVELNFSSTQTQTTSVTRHWGYQAQIPVPAYTKIETTFSVLEGDIDTEFWATFQARGFMKISFDISDPGQSPDWRYCEGQIADMIRGGWCVSNPKTFQCAARGRFQGVAATTYVVETKVLEGAEQQAVPQEFARGRMSWGELPSYVRAVEPPPTSQDDGSSLYPIDVDRDGWPPEEEGAFPEEGALDEAAT